MLFAVWSTFREPLGWKNNAGAMPRSFSVLGRVLTVVAIAVGAFFAGPIDRLTLGIVLVGIGLFIGTLELH